MSAVLTPATPTRLGVALQLVLSRGVDPTDAAGALWRLGARVVLEDDSGRPVDAPVTLTVPGPTGQPPLVEVVRPATGEEIDMFAVMTDVERQAVITFVTQREAQLAAALKLTARAPTLTRAEWQQARRAARRTT